jgi:hypothetical protein
MLYNNIIAWETKRKRKQKLKKKNKSGDVVEEKKVEEKEED